MRALSASPRTPLLSQGMVSNELSEKQLAVLPCLGIVATSVFDTPSVSEAATAPAPAEVASASP